MCVPDASPDTFAAVWIRPRKRDSEALDAADRLRWNSRPQTSPLPGFRELRAEVPLNAATPLLTTLDGHGCIGSRP